MYIYICLDDVVARQDQGPVAHQVVPRLDRRGHLALHMYI